VPSGICGADAGTVPSDRPPAVFPLIPGHEMAGTIADVGVGVEGWQVEDRVAVGWYGGSCARCPTCRSGDVVHCPERRVPGLAYLGAWSTTLTVPAMALARIPESCR
jgi:alcohol dehydrogenase